MQLLYTRQRSPLLLVSGIALYLTAVALLSAAASCLLARLAVIGYCLCTTDMAGSAGVKKLGETAGSNPSNASGVCSLQHCYCMLPSYEDGYVLIG